MPRIGPYSIRASTTVQVRRVAAIGGAFKTPAFDWLPMRSGFHRVFPRFRCIAKTPAGMCCQATPDYSTLPAQCIRVRVGWIRAALCAAVVPIRSELCSNFFCMTTKAVIAAGGFGTRLRSVIGDDLPKALAPVAGVPILFRQLRLLHRYGVREIFVLAGHLSEKLVPAVTEEADRLGLRVQVFVEPRPLGTAGGLPAARERLGDDDFFFLCADIAVEMNLRNLVAHHLDTAASATLVVHPNDHPHDSDLVAVNEEGRLIAVMPRKQRPPGFYRNLVIGSVYCLTPHVFRFIEADQQQDLNNDVFPRMIAAGEPVFVYNTPEYLRDVGSPERLAQVERDIQSGLMERMNAERKRPAVFLDRDGVLNREVGGRGITHLDELELLHEAAAAVRAINDAGHLAIVATNQAAVAKGFITPKYLERIFAKLETLLGQEGAKLDRIYHCPHHPEQGFPGEVSELKILCDCRKPKPGMILRAARELPIDMAESCFIGDSQRDIVAARGASIWAYGVRTGRGCRDCTGVQPVLMFAGPLEAARFAVYGLPEAEDVAKEILDRVSHQELTLPFLVAVCGPQAAGKTTFAHALVRALARRGLKANHVLADQWNRFSPDDPPRVAQPFAYEAIVESILSGEPIPNLQSVLPIDPGAPVTIIDGIWACPAVTRSRIGLGIYVDAHEFVLEDRVTQVLRWMGLRLDETDSVLQQIRKTEWPAVRQQLDLVDHTVRLMPLVPPEAGASR